MNWIKHLLGGAPREIFIKVVVAVISAAILAVFALFSQSLLKWSEVEILRFFAFITTQITVCFLIAWFVRYRTIKKLSEKHKKEVSELLQKIQEDFAKRTQSHHGFVHHARDLVVRMLGPINGERAVTGPLCKEEFHIALEDLLNRMNETFKFLFPPDVKLFTAIRERHGELYETIARGGDTDKKERNDQTEPIHVREQLIIDLLATFNQKDKDCVIESGIGKPGWNSHRKNNARGEDYSVLMGGVFSKVQNPQNRTKFDPVDLKWLLFISANKPDTFQKHHKHLMKCFNDVFSLIVNIHVRQGG